MQFIRRTHFAGLLLCLVFQIHSGHCEELQLLPQTYSFKPGATTQFELQGRLIQAIPGDVIELEEGRYQLTRQLDIVADNLTIRGHGSDKTILSFKNQKSGGAGIESIGDNFVIEGLTIQNTSGNAIKVNGATNVTFRDVKTEWTGPGKSTNGAYGLYPVQCKNVLIEDCTAIGASDAGIYVGQCHEVVVRNSRAERNVAGIEIENTVNADVYGNISTNNTGGILVFDLPGLQVKAGRNVRVFKNKVISNNHPNFAAKGNIVATVPPGTGVMIMATDRVEVFDNDIEDNDSGNLALISFLITEKKITDKQYDPISESISIHDNRFAGGGKKPGGAFGRLLIPVLGTPFPDILFDGITNPDKKVDGKIPRPLQHSIVDNGDASFVNFDLPNLSLINIAKGQYQVQRGTKAYAKKHAPLPGVQLPPHAPPTSKPSASVKAFRAALQKLSEYQLFTGKLADHHPAKGVIAYDLNTALFSDHTSKYRFMRIPKNTQIKFSENRVFEFPIGTIISKTFSYPHDRTDSRSDERLLETRIELKNEDGWHGFSYVWNEEQTDAELALGGSEIQATWIHDDGTTKSNLYQIPNANQCLNCHSENKEFVPIGPLAANLNRDFRYPDGRKNQLQVMHEHGWLMGFDPSTKMEKSFPDAFDPDSATVDERARAWLHVNCAHCHSPSGSARTSGLDLRIVQSDPSKFGVWKSPVAAGHGSGGHDYDIVPGRPEKSILVHRLKSTDPSIMMPNVARQMVPFDAVDLISQWIREMEE